MVLGKKNYRAIKGKMAIIFKKIVSLIEEDPRCNIYPLDIRIVSKIPTELNIHDGIICGTALLYQEDEGEAGLITQDQEIRGLGKVKIVW